MVYARKRIGHRPIAQQQRSFPAKPLGSAESWTATSTNTYWNGQAGSIYKQYAPLVNATKAPGQWNVYDIIYTAPRFNADGSLLSAARITVLQNGVLVQNNTTIKGTTFLEHPAYTAHGDAPIMLQDHGNAVRFRNIWDPGTVAPGQG